MAKKELSEASLFKKYPGSGYADVVSNDLEERPWIPSKVLPINYQLGGGIPYGGILEIHGQESSGKTLLAMDFVYSAISLGGIALWNDAEQSFDRYWFKKNKIDISRVIVSPYTAVEKVSDWVADVGVFFRKKLTNNQPILFVQDSIAALDCIANLNSSQEKSKAEMGNRAKAIYKMLRIRNELFHELGISSIYINQLRQKINSGLFVDPDITPGGNAMKFYAHQRLGVYGGKHIKSKINGSDEQVGRLVSVRVKKNKVAPPRPTYKTQVYFNYDYDKSVGFDKYLGILKILIRNKIITQKGAYYKFEGETIAQGETQFMKLFEGDAKFRKKLIDASGINTISKTRKLLSNIEENLFKVKTDLKIEKQAESDEEE